MKFKSFQEALTANITRQAANDNKKEKQPRYRGTLPALRWLWDNHPDLAEAFAAALPRPSANWFVEVEHSRQEIRPTVGELMAASHTEFGSALSPQVSSDDGGEIVSLGSLKFRNGALVEWGVTKKGKRLKPTDHPRVAGKVGNKPRNLEAYVRLKSTTPSPMEAIHYHRPFSGEDALMPMYDPRPGVTAAKEELQKLGASGDTPFESLPCPATRGPDAVAKGAAFLSGISHPSGNSSDGATTWEAPDRQPSEVDVILEEVAARGNLRSIGIRLGHEEGYADRAGKTALINAARLLTAANDNKKNRDQRRKQGAL